MNVLTNLIYFPYYNLIHSLFIGHPFIGTLSVAVFCTFPVITNLISITEVKHDLFFISIWPGLVLPIAHNWTRSQLIRALKIIPYIFLCMLIYLIICTQLIAITAESFKTTQTTYNSHLIKLN
uniref:Uncharacterized protein n=1 Tax=Glossina pallidipes TaxID=7398 RepID=A0A1A9ZIM2_GLOPL